MTTTPLRFWDAGRDAPHWRSREVLHHVHRMVLVALVPVAMTSVALFGWMVAVQIAVAVACALLCDAVVCTLIERRFDYRNGHTVLLSVVFVLMLPPGTGLPIVGLGAVLMVLSREVFGGLGHYLWHPALISRAVLCLAFTAVMLPEHWPILKKQNLFSGRLEAHEPLPSNLSWFELSGRDDLQAWSGPRPLQLLVQLYRPASGAPSAEGDLLELIRSRLPPASDCLLGTTPGGLGETSIVMILIGGMFLVYRGYVHWTLPVGAVVGAVFAAALLPVPDAAAGGSLWWPLRLRTYVSGHPSLPIGLLWVFYHVIVGEFLFAVFFVASDMTASPLHMRGHFYFGLGIGVLTIVLRSMGFVAGSSYWAVLMMNTLVPLIDRLTRRRVYGT